jgi:hypothetical protein
MKYILGSRKVYDRMEEMLMSDINPTRSAQLDRIEELMALVLKEMKLLLEVISELRDVGIGDSSSRKEQDPAAED